MSTTGAIQVPNAILTEEEAQQFEHNLFLMDRQDITMPTAELSADSVQFLALGGLTLQRVSASAVALAQDTKNYGVGRVFDVFTTSQRLYGQHVARVTSGLQPGSTITDSLTYSGAYARGRAQIMINSELKTDRNGREYYEFMRRTNLVTEGIYGAWSSFDKKNKVQRTLKLYVKNSVDAEGNRWTSFYTLKDGKAVAVQLGDTYIYDGVVGLIQSSGAIEMYNTALNEIRPVVREELSENQQKLFLTVFSTIKGSINTVI